MTENEGGAPRDPQRDPETPPTRPLSESSLGAEQERSGSTDASSPERGPGTPYGAPGPYGETGTAAGYGQPAAAPQYGYTDSPPKNDLGVWALVTGILSYVMCPLLLGIAAIVTGTMSRRAADRGLANNRGMGTAGLVLGWINVVLTLLVVAFVIVALATGLLAGGLSEWGDMNDMNNLDRYGDY